MQATPAGEVESSGAALASDKGHLSDPVMNDPPSPEVADEHLLRDRVRSLEQEVTTLQNELADAESKISS